MSNLPENWTKVTLADVGEITTGNTPPTKQTENYGGGIPFVKPGDLDYPLPITKTEQTLSKKGAEYARLLRPGSVMVSCIGNLGKIGIAGITLATNQQINSIEFTPSLVDDRYGYYFCKTLKPWMEQEASATTVTILNKGRFSKAPFILAPLDEQKRIAEKLDSLLARVDSCQTHLERVPQILKRFRQSVLAAATSGRLTEDWRNGNETNWETHPLGDLCSRVSVGHVGITSKYYTTAEEGIPFLRSQNVRPGRVDLSGLVYITREFHERLKKSQLQAGDLLIVRVGANRGDTCVLPSGFTEINCANIVFARPTKILPAYLGIYFQSPFVQEEMLGKAVGGAQEVVNTKMIEQINVLVPSPEEQAEIVRRVEKLFAYAERLEARYTSAAEHVERLTPSLLAKAFRGELLKDEG